MVLTSPVLASEFFTTSATWEAQEMNVKVKVTQLCPTLCNPMDYIQSMEFSRPEYWNGLPFPPLGDLPDPGIKLLSAEAPALVGLFFTTE